MWIYVIINADIPNLLTECCILQDFRLKDHSPMSESDYNLTNLLNAVEQFKKDGGFGTNTIKTLNITPHYIFTKSTVSESSSSTNEAFGNRSQSMAVPIKNNKDNNKLDKNDRDDRSVFSSITGLFK